jgi:hypothetical protein
VVALADSGISEEEWKAFEGNICWKVIVDEIIERDKVIMQSLRYGSEVWSDEVCRARVNELEYVLTIPQAIITDMKLSQINKKTNNEQGEE